MFFLIGSLCGIIGMFFALSLAASNNWHPVSTLVLGLLFGLILCGLIGSIISTMRQGGKDWSDSKTFKMSLVYGLCLLIMMGTFIQLTMGIQTFIQTFP